MCASAFAIAFVPDVLDFVEGGRLFAIHFLYQSFIHSLAESCSLRFDLKCLVKKVVLACDNVYEVADASWCVV